MSLYNIYGIYRKYAVSLRYYYKVIKRKELYIYGIIYIYVVNANKFEKTTHYWAHTAVVTDLRTQKMREKSHKSHFVPV